MKSLIILLTFISFSAIAKPLAETMKEIQTQKQAKCFKIKESVVACLMSRCKKNYDYLCVTPTGDFDLRLRLNVYTQDGELIEDVTKIIYLN